ncbi:MAG: hypothetical protein WAX69_17445 [Victivallales bacterium]
MEEIIKLLNENRIRYLVIGGQAIRLHGMPRFTMDWDLFIPGKDKENLDMLNKVMEPYLDMPVEPIGPKGQNFVQTYQTQFGVIQFHLAPTGIPDFDEAEKSHEVFKAESGTPVKCISTRLLLDSKLSAARPKDEDDISFLRRLLEK